MHDVVFSQDILRALRERARTLGPGEKIARAVVVLSPLSHVKPETLLETFALTAKGSGFEDVALEVKRLGLHMKCEDCSAEFSVIEPTFSCLSCGSSSLIITNNEEFKVESIEIRKR